MNRPRTDSIPMTREPGDVFKTPNLIRRVSRAVRGLPDRVMHNRRRMVARNRLCQMDRPRSVLVVCHGNICRSPYLAAVLKSSMPDIRVTSAGLVGLDRPAPPFALALAAQRGLDLSTFRSRPLVPALVLNVDLILVMEQYQARHVERYFRVSRKRIVIVGDLDPLPAESRAIMDPWGQSKDVFVASFDRLDRCAAVLVSLLGA